MHNKYIIGIAILVAGGLIGAALATRYYKVGPLAQLKGQESSAEGGLCDAEFAARDAAEATMNANATYSGGAKSVSWDDFQNYMHAREAANYCAFGAARLND